MSDPRDYIDPTFRTFFKNPLTDFNPMAELNKAMEEMNMHIDADQEIDSETNKREEQDEDEMFYGVIDIQPDDYFGVADIHDEGEEIQK